MLYCHLLNFKYIMKRMFFSNNFILKLNLILQEGIKRAAMKKVYKSHAPRGLQVDQPWSRANTCSTECHLSLFDVGL